MSDAGRRPVIRSIRETMGRAVAPLWTVLFVLAATCPGAANDVPAFKTAQSADVATALSAPIPAGGFPASTSESATDLDAPASPVCQAVADGWRTSSPDTLKRSIDRCWREGSRRYALSSMSRFADRFPRHPRAQGYQQLVLAYGPRFGVELVARDE